ncbi:MAG TPA: TetR/AcrR family transcriptional regulator [Anaerolineae bacterium]|nr:TetR/AcrR family transcriptional regulator [Anaerolineae bacterium]
MIKNPGDCARRARQQRRIERRRQEIMAAAVRLFAEKGYMHTTTKEIAEAADVAEGTLYNYFGGKREILLAVINETQSAIETVFNRSGALEMRADLVEVVATLFDLVVSRLAFFRTLMTEAWLDDMILQNSVMERLEQLDRRIQGFIRDKVVAGVYRPVDPALASHMLMGMFTAAVIPALRGLTPPPTAEECRTLAGELVSMMLDGIRVRAR